ncbi:hypothetical protein H4Q26_002241 [Puccinia striiformis f. sp. tritici PST-130]|nr:hypothetical protein H4Q26_002241 [Puccinia striiformis f. sp. tritici PST-130]
MLLHGSRISLARLKSIKQETVGKSDPINHMITPYHLNAPTLNNLHSILAEGAEVNLERPRSPSIAPTPSSYIKSPVIQRPLDLAIVTARDSYTEEPTRKGPTLSKPLGQERSGLLSLFHYRLQNQNSSNLLDSLWSSLFKPPRCPHIKQFNGIGLKSRRSNN